MDKKYIWIIVAVLLAFGIGYTLSRPDSTPTQQNTNNTPADTAPADTQNGNNSLDASGRQLTTLPDDILRQTELTSLNLSNNQLTTLPDEFANLTQLETLNIENNRLEHVPESLKRMTWLKSLDISNNRIPAEEIAALKSSLPDTEIKG